MTWVVDLIVILKFYRKFFRNIEVFKSLDPHYYQCSRRTTSTEIETVFQRAINRQRSHEKFSMPIRCGEYYNMRVLF